MKKQFPHNETAEASVIVPSLLKLHDSFENNKQAFFGMLKATVTKKLWKKRNDKVYRELIEFNSFKEFIETPKYRGLGTTVDELIELIDKNIIEKTNIDENEKKFYMDLRKNIQDNDMEEVKPKGGNNGNQYKKKESGNSTGSAIAKNRDRTRKTGLYRRLKREALKGNKDAQLALDDYNSGKITIGRALIQCGLVKDYFKCQLDINSVVNQIKSKFSKKDIKKIIELLGE